MDRAERRRRTKIKIRKRLERIKYRWRQFLYLARKKIFYLETRQTMRHYKHDDWDWFERTLDAKKLRIEESIEERIKSYEEG